MHSINWNDLRYILAVARAGSVVGAGRALGLNHATVLRHVHAFEKNAGAQLFERKSSGYLLTEQGSELVRSLEQVESAVTEVERKIAARELKPEGVLRVTTTDSLFPAIVSPHLKRFQAKYPDIVLDITVTNMRLDLARREADVAVRPSQNPPEDLIGIRVGDLAFGVYATSDYLNAHPGKSMEEHAWLGLNEMLGGAPPAVWMRETMPGTRVVSRADSFVALQALAHEDLGLTLLPCCVGDTDGRLVRYAAPITPITTSLWVLTHPDLRRSALVRAFLDFFTEALRGEADLLLGRR
ncbi:MAG: LysR family transcriptional regulator [Chromatiales bacterium]|jgi:molybdate transport repressor ModE-like protein|nr:LysR family transcriptional regulator [Chromatiales bacterium]